MSKPHARSFFRWLAGAAAIAGLVSGAAAQLSGGYRYQTGKEVYEHVCQGCHMPDAKGAAGAAAYPALAGNRKLQSPLYPALVILRGQKSMPAFADLTDAQTADVVNYIRSGFGNHFSGTITAAQVKALRPRAVARDALKPG